MKYQTAKILTLKKLEKKIEDRHTEIKSAQKILVNAGISKRIYVLNTERNDES
jgi:hypothetical protein